MEKRHTNDLHLSNEGSANDVDGTWGDWTMQEGESDLFLKIIVQVRSTNLI